jgi:hypothetical protein
VSWATEARAMSPSARASNRRRSSDETASRTAASVARTSASAAPVAEPSAARSEPPCRSPRIGWPADAMNVFVVRSRATSGAGRPGNGMSNVESQRWASSDTVTPGSS